MCVSVLSRISAILSPRKWITTQVRWAITSGTFHRLVHLGFVLTDNSPAVGGAIKELIRGVAQGVARPDLAHVVLHVLGIPAAGVGDEWEGREDEPQLGPEREHRARDGLDVVLTPGDDERRHLVLDQHRVVDR